MMEPKRDEALNEIWVIRQEIAAEVSYDPKKLGAYYRRRQKAAGVKIYRRDAHLTTVK